MPWARFDKPFPESLSCFFLTIRAAYVDTRAVCMTFHFTDILPIQELGIMLKTDPLSSFARGAISFLAFLVVGIIPALPYLTTIGHTSFTTDPRLYIAIGLTVSYASQQKVAHDSRYIGCSVCWDGVRPASKRHHQILEDVFPCSTARPCISRCRCTHWIPVGVSHQSRLMLTRARAYREHWL